MRIYAHVYAKNHAVRKSIGHHRWQVSVADTKRLGKTKKDETLKTFFLSLTPLKQIIFDYYTICESYFNAVKSLPIDKIESIDMGRKGIHNEGARVIIERLENRVKTDLETSRRIFTLVYALTYER